MSTTPEAVTKLYDQLQAPERVTLVLEALARGDPAEAGRLGRTCPRKTYTGNDERFVERLGASFDVMAGACADLGHAAGKLFILTLLSESLDQLLARHRINATLAFFEGSRWAGGEPPGHGYGDSPADAAQPPGVEGDGGDDEGEGEDAGDEVAEDGDAGSEEGEAEGGTAADLSRRLDAVERQSDLAADRLRRVLAGMADAVARPFVEIHAAFDRFARRHLGVDGPTLMRAWQFPRAGDLAATLVAFKHVRPREDVVAELVDQLSAAWKSRLGYDGGEE